MKLLKLLYMHLDSNGFLLATKADKVLLFILSLLKVIQLLSYSLKTIRLCNSFVHVPIVTKRGKAMNIEAHTPMILFLYLLQLRLLVFQFLVFLVKVKLLFRLREVGLAVQFGSTRFNWIYQSALSLRENKESGHDLRPGDVNKDKSPLPSVMEGELKTRHG